MIWIQLQENRKKIICPNWTAEIASKLLNVKGLAWLKSTEHGQQICWIYSLDHFRLIASFNKKVLLRERKRHTAHRVASARYAALSNGGGGGTPSNPGWGVPHPVLYWGVPHPVLAGGYPVLAGGYPIQSWPGGYTIQSWLGDTPHRPDLRWDTPCPDLGWGNPLSRCGLTHKVKILPSPILRLKSVNTQTLRLKNRK